MLGLPGKWWVAVLAAVACLAFDWVHLMLMYALLAVDFSSLG